MYKKYNQQPIYKKGESSKHSFKPNPVFLKAEEALKSDLKSAIKLTNNIITFPVCGKVIQSSCELALDSITLGDEVLNQCSISIDGWNVPFLPCSLTNLSEFNEQCIRIYIRKIIATQYDVDKYSDIVIYVVLALLMQAINSKLSEQTNSTYKQLAYIMLKSKSSNDNFISRLSSLQNGDLPHQHNLQLFEETMKKIGTIFHINVNPLTLWFGMCLAIGDETMIHNQSRNCLDAVRKDYGASFKKENLIATLFSTSDLPPLRDCSYGLERCYEFKCVVTLQDCSEEGGYIILPHVSKFGRCSPKTVLSSDGFEMF
jgi:hypothetical protein